MHSHDAAAERFTRLAYGGFSIYVDPAAPDWFVPSPRSDVLLQALSHGIPLLEAARADSARFGQSAGQSLFLIEKLLARLAGPAPAQYTGRADKHELTRLNECWFHITNRCNLSCRHCMFSSCPSETVELEKTRALAAVREALSLGCRVLYFTGGEPLVYADFAAVCDAALETPDTHVVILTNGLEIPRYKDWLAGADRNRVHFQVSVDGSRQHHDALRGKGTFDRVMQSLELLGEMQCNVTLAMAVHEGNISDMEHVIDIAGSGGIHTVHYIWFFEKGKGRSEDFVAAERIAEALLRAQARADTRRVRIDNIETMKSQVFALPGTRFDLSNAAWQSLAVGPDGSIYPSPAMVGEQAMAAGNISQSIAAVWKQSPLLERVRRTSLTDDPQYSNNPLRFLIGGGDIDHSFISSGSIVGHDPYVEVYNHLALQSIVSEVRQYEVPDTVSLMARMGERLYGCSEDMGEYSFTHSNCVLSLPTQDGHTLVKTFYSAAAEHPNQDILNPVCYDEPDVAHIPRECRVRNYGCGSPVLDCAIGSGETVVDLGSGTGVECFIAAKRVGPKGRVIGIDMADAMLSIAEGSRQKVAAALGYDVVAFKKAFLEQLPLDAGCADAVISNCVINLSPDKRKTLSEMYRVLKPGGRIAVSDIVCDEDIPLGIKYNETLRGECIGGAFRENELFALLGDLGFEAVQLEKRFPYRDVQGHMFYSITYSARKPAAGAARHIIYRGPFAAVVTDSGTMLVKGQKTDIDVFEDFPLGDSVFVLDAQGHVCNIAQQTGSCCPPPKGGRGPKLTLEACSCPPGPLQTQPAPENKRPEERGCSPDPPVAPSQKPEAKKHQAGCMVCGAELQYTQEAKQLACHYCGSVQSAQAVCTDGHFVCDACHVQDALAIIKQVCLSGTERDMIALLKKTRTHHAFPLHGPEHHALVPGIILAAYKNTTGSLTNEKILMGIQRGTQIPGGFCAFMGACGASIGVGIAFGIILDASPLKSRQRQIVQKVTAEVLQHIAEYAAPRCCQRECYTALLEASRLSRQYLDVVLVADEPLLCVQYTQNKECIRKACPLWAEAEG